MPTETEEGEEMTPSAMQDDTNDSENDDGLQNANTESVPTEKLGVLPLAVLVFYSVSGGPFGVEASVRSAGNLLALLGFLVFPLVWSVQEAAITAELSSTFVESSGGVAWVEEAFGSLAGWMAGYLGWVSGATDNAIYPVLFLDYFLEDRSDDVGSKLHPLTRFLLLAGISLILAYINWLGLAVVGRMSIAICIASMSPFVILTLVGMFQCDPSLWLRLPSDETALEPENAHGDYSGLPKLALSGVMWRPFLNNLFWNLNSFDSVSSMAADVEDPGRVFPQAMLYAVIMVSLGYFLPLLVALGATDAPQNAWEDGYLARVASDVVGPWLGAWTVFAAGISNIALFQAELSADSFQIMGMTERGFLPAFFTRRSRHGTPTYGITLGTAVIIVMGTSDLDSLIEMLNFNYSISLLLEYCAFIKLRISRPDLPRPWKVPLGTAGCILALIPTMSMILVVIGLATSTTYLFCIATNLIGYLLYKAKEHEEHEVRCCGRKRYARVPRQTVSSAGSIVADGDTFHDEHSIHSDRGLQMQ